MDRLRPGEPLPTKTKFEELWSTLLILAQPDPATGDHVVKVTLESTGEPIEVTFTGHSDPYVGGGSRSTSRSVSCSYNGLSDTISDTTVALAAPDDIQLYLRVENMKTMLHVYPASN